MRPSSLSLSSPKANSPGEESSFAFKNHIPSPLALRDNWGPRGSSNSRAFNSFTSADHLGDNWILKNRSPSPVPHCDNWSGNDPATSSFASNRETWDVTNESGLGESRTSGLSTSIESEFKSSFERSVGTLAFPFEQPEPKASAYSVNEEEVQEDCQNSVHMSEDTMSAEGKVEVEEEKRGLQRSSSRVSEKALLFSQMQEKIKQAAEEAHARRLPKGNCDFNLICN